MFSAPIQSLLVQARVEELHRVAHTSIRRSAFAAPGSDVSPPETAPLSTLLKRALGRVFDVGRVGSGAAAIHGVELVGHPSTMTWSPRR